MGSGPLDLIHKDHMIQFVDGFEADDERRVSVLLEHGRRKERSLETMCRVMADDAAETAQRRAAGRRLGVVRKRVQVLLNGERRAQPRDQPSFGWREYLPFALCSLLSERRIVRAAAPAPRRARPVSSRFRSSSWRSCRFCRPPSCAACDRSHPGSRPRRAPASAAGSTRSDRSPRARR